MVAIKNIEIPKSCNDCNFFSWVGDCMILLENVEYNYTENSRYDDCPLTEIESNNKIIQLPNWARIDKTILVKDFDCIRGDNPNDWYKEKIIGFGYDGVFHQAHNCPMYYSKFTEYGKTIKECGYDSN